MEIRNFLQHFDKFATVCPKIKNICQSASFCCKILCRRYHQCKYCEFMNSWFLFSFCSRFDHHNVTETGPRTTIRTRSGGEDASLIPVDPPSLSCLRSPVLRPDIVRRPQKPVRSSNHFNQVLLMLKMHPGLFDSSRN